LETGYPLYRAEYGQHGQIAATLEVTEFNHGLAARAPADMAWWQETRAIREHDGLDSALRDFSVRGITVPDAGSLPAGYELVRTQVVDADLNDERTLVQSFSDGIDEIFLLTTINTTRSEILDRNPGSSREVNLMVFHDLNTSQLMFYHGDLRYQLIGRPAAGRLNSLARSLIRSAYR
jgi:hypothetical protein